MRMLQRLMILTAIASLAAIHGLAETPAAAIGETNPFASLAGNRFHGSWWGTGLGPVPQLVSFDPSGNFVWRSGFDRGGYTLFDHSFSPFQGVWRRTGGRTAEALGVRFVYDADGTLFGAERGRFKLSFGADFQTLEGTVTLEEVLCEDVPVGPPFNELPSCPDITTAPADVVRGPIAASLKRLPLDAGQ